MATNEEAKVSDALMELITRMRVEEAEEALRYHKLAQHHNKHCTCKEIV